MQQQSQIRRNGYKKNFIHLEHLDKVSETVRASLEESCLRWQRKELSDCQLVAETVLLFLKTLRPKDFLGGPHRQWEPNPGLPEVVQIFDRHSLRSIPLSVNRTLVNWSMQKYPLQLTFAPLTTLEIIDLQCQGIRCVTLPIDQKSLKTYILEERDPFSFILHDLIHADHFFRDPVQTEQQRSFSRLMLYHYRKNTLDFYFKENLEFKKQVDYLASDMNAHIIHFIKYLRAIIDILFDQQNYGKEASMKLFIDLFEVLQPKDDHRIALTKINQPDFNLENAESIIALFKMNHHLITL